MKKLISLLLISIIIMLVLDITVYAQRNAKMVLKASIEGVSTGNISKELLLKQGLIQCSNHEYEVIYYNFSLLRDNGDLVVYNGKGNSLSEAMKAEIKALKPGSKLVIEEISAKSIDEKIIKLPSIVLALK